LARLTQGVLLKACRKRVRRTCKRAEIGTRCAFAVLTRLTAVIDEIMHQGRDDCAALQRDATPLWKLLKRLVNIGGMMLEN